MDIGRTCPKCECFDLRALEINGDDLHAFRCHDCGHVFYVTGDTMHREHTDRVAGKVTELLKKHQPRRS